MAAKSVYGGQRRIIAPKTMFVVIKMFVNFVTVSLPIRYYLIGLANKNKPDDKTGFLVGLSKVFVCKPIK